MVESDFGYHVIQLAAVRGGEKKSYESVRAEIEAEFRNQQAQKLFSQAAVDFDDMVYQQSESLKPAADRWKLEIVKADHVTARARRQGHRAARQRQVPGGPLLQRRDPEQAQHQGDRHRRQQARRRPRRQPLAGAPAAAGGGEGPGSPAARRQPGGGDGEEARRREARGGARGAPDALSDNTLIVSRAQTRDLPRQVVDAALKAPVATLPAHVGVDLGDQGYAVVRITKLWGRDPGAADPAKAQGAVRAGLGRRRGPGLLRRAQDALQGDGQRIGPGLARRRGERAVLSPGGFASEPARVACYNRPLGGGCSSVGRVQDCDSCCRGFEPHQPPQRNPAQIRHLGA